jgi:hypothetical protein
MRPAVKFDAKNPEHRAAYHQFLQTGTWGRLPFRFSDSQLGNTLGVMQRELLQYYTGTEFYDRPEPVQTAPTAQMQSTS